MAGGGLPSATREALRSWIPAGISETTNARLKSAANAEKEERWEWRDSTARRATVDPPYASVPTQSAAPPLAAERNGRCDVPSFPPVVTLSVTSPRSWSGAELLHNSVEQNGGVCRSQMACA